ncbi:MAG: sigma 54-interacting transcriptional regulator [Holophagales bacterium]|nr:sigma 54-interacting transcriptional regulator [Holophagales bacterium]
MSGTSFIRFLGRLSSRLTSVQADEMNDEIVRTLEGLVKELGTDRATFYQFDSETRAVDSQRQWARPGIDLDPAIVVRDLPWIIAKVLAGETFVMNAPDELPSEAEAERRFCDRVGMKSNVTIPVSVGGRLISVIATGTFTAPRRWTPDDVERLRIVGEVLAGAVDRRSRDLELKRSLEEVRALRDQLAAENDLLREELGSSHDFQEIVGESSALKRTLALVSQVAPTGATVLLLGETGTGKELLARAVHERSPRRGRAMVRVNCAAIPPTLIESELFGHERGAFTGAIATKIGRFELANGGTLFLDEIGDLGLDLQTKLLRVLQEGEFERVGSSQTRKTDVRLVAATHHDLPAAVDSGGFRADLYYRLNVFPIRVPPLRERRDDVPLLVWWFIHRRQKEMGRQIDKVPRRTMERLSAYPWPGNVRELENVVERALILSPGTTLQVDESFSTGDEREPRGVEGPQALDAVERAHVAAILTRCDGRIEGPGAAAETLGLKPSTLRSRMKKLGIRRA